MSLKDLYPPDKTDLQTKKERHLRLSLAVVTLCVSIEYFSALPYFRIRSFPQLLGGVISPRQSALPSYLVRKPNVIMDLPLFSKTHCTADFQKLAHN